MMGFSKYLLVCGVIFASLGSMNQCWGDDKALILNSQQGSSTIRTNEIPPAPVDIISDKEFYVSEDAEYYSSIGFIDIVLESYESDQISFRILSGNDYGMFKVSKQGELKVRRPQRILQRLKDQFVLKVAASYGKTTDVANITINITDSNNNESYASDLIHDESFYIGEDVDTVSTVGFINTITATESSNELRFRILTGNALGIFNITEDGELQIGKPDRIFQRESDEIVLQIEVSSGDMVDTANVKIHVIESELSFYINSATGNDSNDGSTPANAWKSIEKINSTVFSPGDAVFFSRDGVWHEGLVVNQSGTEEAPIVYSSYGNGLKPKLYFSQDTTIRKPLYGIYVLEKTNLVINDFEIEGWVRYGIGIRNKSTNNLLAKNIIIDRVEIHDIDPLDKYSPISMGIALSNTPINVKILNSKLYNLNMEGIMASSKDLEVGYCLIENVAQTNSEGDCIQLNNVADRYYVHHNILDHTGGYTGKGAFVCSHDGRKSDDAYAGGLFEYNTVYNGNGDNFGFTTGSLNDTVRYNAFFYNKDKGILPGTGAQPFGMKGAVTAYYNIFKDYPCSISAPRTGETAKYFNNLLLNNTTKYALFVQGNTAPTISFFNNIVEGKASLVHARGDYATLTAGNNVYTSEWSLYDEVDSIVGDPQFIDPANGDYRLSDTSIARDAGRSTTDFGVEITVDFAGNAIDQVPNIGVFE